MATIRFRDHTTIDYRDRSQWHAEGRAFPGLITWPQWVYGRMTYGELADTFEEIARQDDPLTPYPIIHIRPRE